MNRFKGIALVGEHGAGKTTLADKLVQRMDNAVKAEISTLVIRPLLGRTSLPTTYEELVSEMVAVLNQPPPTELNRYAGMAAYDQAVQKFGDDVAARLVLSISERLNPGKYPVVSGVRAKAVVAHLKKAGFLLVYLDAPRQILAERISGRQGTPTQETLQTLEDEERKYQTHLTRPECQLILDTEHMSSDKVAETVLAFLA